MVMKLVFNGHNIIIQNIIPEERSLQFSALNSDVTFEVLKELEYYTGTIEYYEDDVLMMEYVNYYKNFGCTYSSSSFNVVLSQISKQEVAIQKNRDYIQMTADALDQFMAIYFGGM